MDVVYAASIDVTHHNLDGRQRIENVALNRGAAMRVNEEAYEANDVYLAGILIISLLCMIIGILLGLLIAS